MPTYEYECTRCGHRFEKFHSISGPAPKRCPECRCKVKRMISGGAGLLFKGSGFYTTDYRSDGYKKASKADQGGGAEAKAGGTDKGGGSSAPAKAAAE
jgi:putative FmdB family regulatory protein